MGQGPRSRAARCFAFSLLTVLLLAGCSAASSATSAGRPGGFTGSGPASPQPRRSFSPLVAYASFGWLPPGFSVSAGKRMALANWTTTQSLFLNAGAPATGQVLELTVQAAGSCRLTGPQLAAGPGPASPPGSAAHRKRYPHGLSCGAGAGGGHAVTLLTGSVPPLRGMPAYGTADGGLAWEYARNSWARLDSSQPDAIGGGSPAPARQTVSRPLQRRVAAGVSYRSTRLAFPFRLTGVPPGWRVAQGYLTEVGGRLAGIGLGLGPASGPLALDVGVSLPGGQPSCSYVAGHSRYVRLDGARGILVTIRYLPFKNLQSLCAAQVRGLQLYLSLDRIVPGTRGRYVPGARALGSILAVFGHLILLGPDPAGWTTHPLAS